ncbi:MAG: hypothetical protein IPP16_20685 [Acidimicrobiaceae bacterium]|nr:hypothetical protein [Acidimicrobiaceae bacterium]
MTPSSASGSPRADEIGELYERPQQFIEAPAVKQMPHPLPFTAFARPGRRGAIAAIMMPRSLATLPANR